jgi:predicted RNase H-like HicB family nuclease
MKLNYTYWNEDDFLVGFLDDLPGWWTQGKSIQELETMLLDLYDLCDDEESMKSAKTTDADEEILETLRHGTIKIPVAVAAAV